MDPVLAFFSRNERRAAVSEATSSNQERAPGGAATPFGPLAKIAIEEGSAL